MTQTERPILEQAAAGVPVRQLLRDHREAIAAVIGTREGGTSGHPRGAFDPGSRKEAPWGFISKR